MWFCCTSFFVMRSVGTSDTVTHQLEQILQGGEIFGCLPCLYMEITFLILIQNSIGITQNILGKVAEI